MDQWLRNLRTPTRLFTRPGRVTCCRHPASTLLFRVRWLGIRSLQVPQSSQAQAVKSSGDAERAEPSETAKLTEKLATRTRAARELALNYISLWSAPNPVALASAPSFYGSVVRFHGSVRSAASVIAEKRRFVQRWPNRDYRYRPGETFVGCEAKSDYCTVWSIFDFSATNAETKRHSRGIAEHELIVSFESEWPIMSQRRAGSFCVGSRGMLMHGASGFRCSPGLKGAAASDFVVLDEPTHRFCRDRTR